MKKYVKYLLLAWIIILTAAGNASAVKAEGAKNGTAGENVTWKLEDGVMTISGSGKMDDYQTFVDGSTGEVLEGNIAPWEDFKDDITKVVVEGKVSYIGYAAFNRCYNLKEVILSDNVKELGCDSFANDRALTSISIGSGLERIYDCALYGTSIKELYLPKGFQEMEDSSGLNGLCSLERFIVEEGNAYYTAVDGVLCTKDKKAIVRVPGNIGASYTIPSHVTELIEYSFSKSNIETITIPNTVKKIGNFSFSNKLTEIPKNTCYYCPKLEEVIIPEGIETIGWGAFRACSNLNTVEIPYSVTFIDDAFPENTKLNMVSSDLTTQDGGLTYRLYSTIKLEVYQNYTEAFKVLDIVNKERKAEGLSPLKMDKSLLSTAMLRAAELCVKFSHDRPDGRDCFSADELIYRENIAAGHESASAAMNGWMNSKGHRANILGDFKTVGIGCVEYDGTLYWVQCFGRELSEEASKSSCKDGNKTRTIHAVMFDTPVLSGVSNTSTGVKISWKEVEDAEKYRVYRKVSGGSRKKVCDTTSTSCTDKNAESGTKYTYTVRCINRQDNSAASRYDKKGKSIVYLETPSLNDTSCSTSGLKMSWKEVEGAESYYVYLKTSDGWKKQAEVTGKSYTYKKASSGKKYTFTVRAVKGSTKSSYVSKGKTGLFLATPELGSIKKTSGKVKLTWKSVKGAEKYYVYRKESGGSWKRIKTVTSSSYTDGSSLKKGTTYIYTVKAVKDSTVSAYDKTGLKIK